MDAFFDLLFNFYSNIFYKFEKFSFNIAGYPLSIVDVAIGCLLISFAISIFWRGAKG